MVILSIANHMVNSLVCLLLVSASALFAQDAPPGQKIFETRCARCHGADGNGGEMGPPILTRIAARDDQQLTALVHNGIPAKGMPPTQVTPAEMTDLLRYLRRM